MSGLADSHVALWTAVSAVSGTVALALVRLIYQIGFLSRWLTDLHENQQVIATRQGIELPHPLTKK